MKKQITISIKNPCTENWNEFKTTQHGAFCGSCRKEVIDFSVMRESELLFYLKDLNGNSCGKFKPHQLKAYTQASSIPSYSLFQTISKSILSVSLLFLSSSLYSYADEVKPTTFQIVEDTLKTHKNRQPSGNIVSGKVVDAYTGEGLSAVKVLLKDSSIETITDLNGFFTFPEPLKVGDVLFFYSIGMQSNSYLVEENAMEQLVIKIEMDNHIMGGLSIEGLDQEESPKKSFWQQLISRFN